jgi:hypothetical protein
MKILRRLETDGTWDQDLQSKRVERLARGHVFSFDLSSATDRFPVDLQVSLLEVLMNPTYAK